MQKFDIAHFCKCNDFCFYAYVTMGEAYDLYVPVKDEMVNSPLWTFITEV